MNMIIGAEKIHPAALTTYLRTQAGDGRYIALYRPSPHMIDDLLNLRLTLLIVHGDYEEEVKPRLPELQRCSVHMVGTDETGAINRTWGHRA